MKNNIFIVVVLFFYTLLIVSITVNNTRCKVDLPEEYKLIRPTDNLKAYFDKDSVLHISFDKAINFEWEGAESDIPQDGIRQLHLTTNENTVYLNPVDE